jgi:hypothetical protein
VTAAYPASILSWTQRVNSQTVWAADPNTLAAEIDAVEQYVGINPQIESSALTAATKTFSSMSARLSDAMLQRGHPYVSINRTSNWNVYHNSSGTHTTQNAFNNTVSGWGNYVGSGGSITIRDTGVWFIEAGQRWQYATSGWVMQELYAGGSVLDRDIFSYSQFPQSGSNVYGERFLYYDGYNKTTFLGRLTAGTSIHVASGNFTNLSPLQVQSMYLSLYYLRP